MDLLVVGIAVWVRAPGGGRRAAPELGWRAFRGEGALGEAGAHDAAFSWRGRRLAWHDANPEGHDSVTKGHDSIPEGCDSIAEGCDAKPKGYGARSKGRDAIL